jgi:hypothetical protein
MDLLSVLMHELGHVYGYEHAADGVMAETLVAGTRQLPDAESALPGTDVPRTDSIAIASTMAMQRNMARKKAV